MTTKFDSFDGSELGSFTKSPLGERNGVSGDVLLWGTFFGVLSQTIQTFYGSLGLNVHDKDSWTGSGADYGLIINKTVIGDPIPWFSDAIANMHSPKRVYFATGLEAFSISLGGLTIVDFMSWFAPVVTNTGHPLGIGSPETIQYSSAGRYGWAIGGASIYRETTLDMSAVSVNRSGGVEWVSDSLTLISGEAFLRRLWEVPGP